MNDKIDIAYIKMISESTTDDIVSMLASALHISNDEAGEFALKLTMEFNLTDEDIEKTAKLIANETNHVSKDGVIGAWTVLNSRWIDESTGKLMFDLSEFERFDELRWLINDKNYMKIGMSWRDFTIPIHPEFDDCVKISKSERLQKLLRMLLSNHHYRFSELYDYNKITVMSNSCSFNHELTEYILKWLSRDKILFSTEDALHALYTLSYIVSEYKRWDNGNPDVKLIFDKLTETEIMSECSCPDDTYGSEMPDEFKKIVEDLTYSLNKAKTSYDKKRLLEFKKLFSDEQ